MENEFKIPDGCMVESFYKYKICGKDAMVLIFSHEHPPKPGDLCIFWDEEKSFAVISLLKCITSETDYPFKAETGVPYKHCVKYCGKEQYMKYMSSKP